MDYEEAKEVRKIVEDVNEKIYGLKKLEGPKREHLNFGEALDFVKKGFIAYRIGWNGKNMHIALRQPDEDSDMTLPYICTKTADGHFVPWLASQTDLLSEDWIAGG